MWSRSWWGGSRSSGWEGKGSGGSGGDGGDWGEWWGWSRSSDQEEAQWAPHAEEGQRHGEEGQSSAVAERAPLPPPQVFNLQYFQAFTNFTRGYKQHNAALKSFRESFEDPQIL